MMVPFTGLGLHDGFRGDVWFKNRIEIFKSYTLKSLMNQTNKNFVLWLTFRPEERDNPLTIDLYNYLRSLSKETHFIFNDKNLIFTYSGICFWDDKYPKDKLINRLVATLPEMKEIVKGYDWVYQTIQPSDDMFIDTAVEQIQSWGPEHKRALVWKKGYIIRIKNHQVAEYNPNTFPPFSTIIFPTDEFLDPAMHYIYIGPYKSHEYVKDCFNCVELDGRGFLVGVHGDNISTMWSTFRGEEFIDPEKESILARFGLGHAKPIKVRRRRGRLIVRAVCNRLPEPIGKAVKRWYYNIINR